MLSLHLIWRAVRLYLCLQAAPISSMKSNIKVTLRWIWPTWLVPFKHIIHNTLFTAYSELQYRYGVYGKLISIHTLQHHCCKLILLPTRTNHRSINMNVGKKLACITLQCTHFMLLNLTKLVCQLEQKT